MKSIAIFAGRFVVVVVVLSVVALASLVSGCGGPPKAAQTALSVTATGVQVADEATATAYALRADTCYVQHDTAEGYRECVSKVDAAVVGVRTARASLHASQAALDAWKAGATDDGFLALVPCLAETVYHLIELGEAVGIDMPTELGQAVGLLGVLGGRCE